jgi:PAS domain S-box-containing protein
MKNIQTANTIRILWVARVVDLQYNTRRYVEVLLRGGSMKSSIAFIAPYKKLGELFSEVCRDLHKDIHIEIGDLDEGVRKAIQLEDMGFDVVISRGGTAITMRDKLVNLSVVEIPVSGFDLVRVLKQAKGYTDRVAIVGAHHFTEDIRGIGEILDMKLKVVTLLDAFFRQTENIREKLKEVKGLGIEWVIGDTISVKIAKRLGLNALLIRSGKDALIQSIFEAERVLEVKRLEMEKAKRLQSIIDYAYEGIISVDCTGIIDIFNPRAEELFNKEAYKIIGKNIMDVLPGLDILKSVQETSMSKGKVLTVEGLRIVANIIPIMINSELVRVIVTFQKATQIQRIEQKIREELYLKGHMAESSFEDLIGQSKTILDVIEEARNYAQVNSPILISGETGTGKELFAQAIHNASMRKNKPFIAVNCAALPENLLESELFGYVEGAFTGANRRGKLGLFEQAHEGTILLDEIGEISTAIQARLLRVIQEQKVRRLGDNKLTHVDVRIMASTNKDLHDLVQNKKFREDLYYRINVLNLTIPPLRERQFDVQSLVEHFLGKYRQKFKSAVLGISYEGVQLLIEYDWPGNVRQLENIVERLMVRSREGYITANDVRWVMKSLPGNKLTMETEDSTRTQTLKKNILVPLIGSLEDIERKIIKKVIQKENGNKTAAATKLGIGRTTLWRKINSN